MTGERRRTGTQHASDQIGGRSEPVPNPFSQGITEYAKSRPRCLLTLPGLKTTLKTFRVRHRAPATAPARHISIDRTSGGPTAARYPNTTNGTTPGQDKPPQAQRERNIRRACKQRPKFHRRVTGACVPVFAHGTCGRTSMIFAKSSRLKLSFEDSSSICSLNCFSARHAPDGGGGGRSGE